MNHIFMIPDLTKNNIILVSFENLRKIGRLKMRMTIHTEAQESHSILGPNNISHFGIRYGSTFNEIKSTYTYNLKSEIFQMFYLH